jgi:hypothetical protein
MPMKKSTDTIGNRTRAVPQPTVPPRPRAMKGADFKFTDVTEMEILKHVPGRIPSNKVDNRNARQFKKMDVIQVTTFVKMKPTAVYRRSSQRGSWTFKCCVAQRLID